MKWVFFDSFICYHFLYFFFYSILLRVELLSWKPTQKTTMMMIVSSASASLNHLQLRGVEADHHFWSIKFSCFYYFVLLYNFVVKKNKRQPKRTPNRNQRKNIIFIPILNLFKLIVILFCVLYFKLIFNLFASSFSTSTFHLVSWYFNSLLLLSFFFFIVSVFYLFKNSWASFVLTLTKTLSNLKTISSGPKEVRS